MYSYMEGVRGSAAFGEEFHGLAAANRSKKIGYSLAEYGCCIFGPPLNTSVKPWA